MSFSSAQNYTPLVVMGIIAHLQATSLDLFYSKKPEK
jgi:hypothetical protein